MNSLPVLSPYIAVELGAPDRPRIAEFCRRCSDFFELIEGQPGGTTTAAEILGPLPEHVTSGTKRVFGVEWDGNLAALIEILEAFPAPNEWQIGLLLVRPQFRNAGLGTHVWQSTRDWIFQRGGVLVRLVVQRQNPGARRFWERQGFTIERDAVVTLGSLSSSAWVMSLPLASGT